MSTTAGTPYNNTEEKPEGRASSASDNKQNVRCVQNCRGSSVQTVLLLAVSYMSEVTRHSIDVEEDLRTEIQTRT